MFFPSIWQSETDCLWTCRLNLADKAEKRGLFGESCKAADRRNVKWVEPRKDVVPGQIWVSLVAATGCFCQMGSSSYTGEKNAGLKHGILNHVLGHKVPIYLEEKGRLGSSHLKGSPLAMGISLLLDGRLMALDGRTIK